MGCVFNQPPFTMSQANISVYFIKANNFSELQLNRLCANLPDNQRTKAEGFKNPKRYKEFVVGRTLALHALNQRFSNSSVRIIEQLSAAPIIEAKERCYVSLSHSNDLVACVLDSSPIGLDIEYKKKRKNHTSASSFFMNDKELLQLERLTNEEEQRKFFYTIWCAKEAIYKMLSPEQQQERTLKSLSVHDFSISKECELLHKDLGDFHLCLAHQGQTSQLQLINIDLANF